MDGRPAFSPGGGEIAVAVSPDCRGRRCGDQDQFCRAVIDRVDVVDLRGRLKRSWRIGADTCSSDGNLGNDDLSDVAWQPLPRGAG